ncbi:HAD family hydrolase [Pseudoalteromonas fenneropenaei]|uniref:HAD family hydrolase n=1 Tax=Pseudoalteromonas fenneropenaei TaxID=1737459 RepID=A0ABV7CEJ3_9GAMM
MTLKAVLFDFDGTLVDSEALHYHSWCKVLAPYGIGYSEATFCDEFSGVPTLESAAILAKRHQLPRSAEALTDEKNRYFIETAKTMVPNLMPGAKTVLAQLQGQVRLALVTGSSKAEAMPVLQHYGLLDYFETIVCKEDVTAPKPHPAPYLQALARMQLSAEQAVAIEDSGTGLQSALAAELRTIVIPNAHSKDQNFNGAWYRAVHLEDAVKTLLALAK